MKGGLQATLTKNKNLTFVLVVVVIIAVAVFASSYSRDEDGKKRPWTPGEPNPASEPDYGNATQVRFEDSGFLLVGLGGVGDSADYEFPVDEGAIGVWVICNGSGNGGLEDIDMEVTGAVGGKASSGNPGSHEEVFLDDQDITKRFGYGTYNAHLICYAGAALSYDLTVIVYYPPNATE